MSWYAKELVQCPGCENVFSTPIDCHQHRLLCTWKTTHYPNGSLEKREEKSGKGYLKAPNTFGGSWIMQFKDRIYGAGGNPDAEGIHRRKRKWYPHFEVGVGWSWK